MDFSFWPTFLWLFVIGFLRSSFFVNAEPCEENPDHPEIVQVTTQACQCCVSPSTYIKQHEFVYLLFYAPGSRLNLDILGKYEDLYKEYKHTKIHFGRVDVNIDAKFANSWLEPNQIPTNIMFRNGEPIRVATEDFEKIVSVHQGSAEGQKLLLSKYFGGKHSFDFHYARPVDSLKFFDKLMAGRKSKGIKGKQKMVFACFGGMKESDPHVRNFREAVWKKKHFLDGVDVFMTLTNAVVFGASIFANKRLAAVERLETRTKKAFLLFLEWSDSLPAIPAKDKDEKQETKGAYGLSGGKVMDLMHEHEGDGMEEQHIIERVEEFLAGRDDGKIRRGRGISYQEHAPHHEELSSPDHRENHAPHHEAHEEL